MSLPRIDFFTHVHKRLRQWLFAVATQIGTIDFSDQTALDALETEFNALVKELREHADHENTFIVPLIASKIPKSADSLGEEHDEQEADLDELVSQFSHLGEMPANHEKRNQVGLEFYRAFNRFIADYLCHLDHEEYLMQNLWEICTHAELIAMMIAFQTSDGKQKGEQWLKNTLPLLNPEEQRQMFATIQTLAPLEIAKTIDELAKPLLKKEIYEDLKKHQLIS